MRRTALLPLSVLLLIHAGTDLAAQKRQDERTLLWEISGNGLATPSYLYGTMHVYDKRAFDFSDSVLLKLQSCTIFAAEVLLDQSLRDVIRYYRNQDAAADAIASEAEPDPVVVEAEAPEFPFVGPLPPRSPEHGDEIAVAVPDSGSERMQPITVADAPLMREPRRRNRRISVDLFNEQQERRPGDSPVVLDAYLSRVAKKEGKEMVALEQAGEQLEALSYNDPIALWKFYLSRPKHLRNLSEEQVREMMLKHYRSGDVEKINSLMRQVFPPGMYEKFIVERNRNMAERAETHMRRGSTFIAVGAGHLGGKKGLIRLFRDRGFTVRPVRAVRTGLAKRYREPERRMEWFSFSSPEGAYSVELPSEPIDARDVAGVVGDHGDQRNGRLYLWIDILTGINYSVGYYDYDYGLELTAPQGDALNYPASLFAYGDGVRKGTPISIGINGVPGKEAKAELPDGSIKRSRLYARGNRLYILSAQTTPELIGSEDPERFFSSFHIGDPRPTEFRRFVSSDAGFSVMLPGIPDMRVDTSRLFFDGYEAWAFSRDSNSGEGYRALCTKFSDVTWFSDTATLFNSVIESLIYSERDSITKNEPMQWQGLPGREVEIVNGANGFTRRAIYVLQGNRLYSLSTAAARERIYSENNATFFSSLRILRESADGDMFSDKRDLVFSDLASDDSLRQVRGAAALPLLELTHEDISALAPLLYKSYHADNEYSSVRSSILYKLGALRDSSLVGIIRELYPNIADDRQIRSAALSALGEIRTDEALDLFAELILSDSSDAWDEPVVFTAFMPLHQDLPASRRIYPDILGALENNNYRDDLYALTAAMLRDSLLSAGDIAPYASVINRHLGELMGLRAEGEESYDYGYLLQNVIECAGFLPASDTVRAWLDKLRNDADLYVASAATIASIRQGIEVGHEEIARLTPSGEMALLLYRSLDRIGRTDLFPSPFRTQESFAGALFTEWFLLQNDYLPDSIRYLGEREVKLHDEGGRAFLFAFRESPEGSWYVGISGLQPTDPALLNSTPRLIGSSYALLDASDIDAHFEALLHDDAMRRDAATIP